MSQEFLNTREAAILLGVAMSTMECWRFLKKGPAWTTTDGYHIRYDKNELLQWRALHPKKEADYAHLRAKHGSLVS